MSLIVKIMSAEDLADDNTQKSYCLHTGVASVAFHRRSGKPVAEIQFVEQDVPYQYTLEGNVYVMNENGKTISSFGVADPTIDPPEELP